MKFEDLKIGDTVYRVDYEFVDSKPVFMTDANGIVWRRVEPYPTGMVYFVTSNKIVGKTTLIAEGTVPDWTMSGSVSFFTDNDDFDQVNDFNFGEDAGQWYFTEEDAHAYASKLNKGE